MLLDTDMDKRERGGGEENGDKKPKNATRQVARQENGENAEQDTEIIGFCARSGRTHRG